MENSLQVIFCHELKPSVLLRYRHPDLESHRFGVFFLKYAVNISEVMRFINT